MGVQYVPVSQDANEASSIQWRDNSQILRKHSFWTRLLALIAATSMLLNVIMILHGPKDESNELYPGIIPQIPHKHIVFQENMIYSSPLSNESNQAWDDLLPPGRGFVYVQDASNHGLQPGDQLKTGEAFSVAVFHQLHCLGMLRNNYWTLIDRAANKDFGLEAWATRLQHNHHANHCFDYLRQSLQCAGDMALEWPTLESSGRRKSVDGWSVPHQCRDWEVIMEYMEQNHVIGSKRADISGE